MYGRSVVVGHTINTVHWLNEKLITIWKSEGSPFDLGLTWLPRESGSRVAGPGSRFPTPFSRIYIHTWTHTRFFGADACTKREFRLDTCYEDDARELYFHWGKGGKSWIVSLLEDSTCFDNKCLQMKPFRLRGKREILYRVLLTRSL